MHDAVPAERPYPIEPVRREGSRVQARREHVPVARRPTVVVAPLDRVDRQHLSTCSLTPVTPRTVVGARPGR